MAVNRVGPEDRDAGPPACGSDLAHERAARVHPGVCLGASAGRRDRQPRGAGRYADLCILDRDVYDRGAGPIGDARVRLTMVEGEPVFDPDNLLA